MRFDRILITKFNHGMYIDFMSNYNLEYVTLHLNDDDFKVYTSVVINEGIIRIINQKQLFYES